MPREREYPHKINDKIQALQVRLVGMPNEAHNGVMPTTRALALAQEQTLDLVEVSPNAEPPVCRIVDYSKFLFEQKKKEKEAKAKQVKSLLKEVRFGPNTSEHDYQFKLKHAEEFLKEGHKVKAYIHFHGRTIVHRERSQVILENLIKTLEPISKVESPLKMEGKRMIVILAPTGKK
jgi:translation initiation factor IF-3